MKTDELETEITTLRAEIAKLQILLLWQTGHLPRNEAAKRLGMTEQQLTAHLLQLTDDIAAAVEAEEAARRAEAQTVERRGNP